MRQGLVVALTCLAAACARDPNRVPLTAPFDGALEVGQVHATWRATEEVRDTGGAGALARPQRRVEYRVEARNGQREELFVRLAGFRLVDGAGHEVGGDSRRAECVLGAWRTAALLTGTIWVDAAVAEKVRGFRVDHFAVPLGDADQRRYREWLLQARPAEAGQVASELGRVTSAPGCDSVGH